MASRWAWIAAWGVAAAAGPASAEPPTSYFTDQYVQHLRAAVKKHAWLVDHLNQLVGKEADSSRAGYWMGLSFERFEELIPSRPPFPHGATCPQCDNRFRGRAGYTFSRDPFRFVCPSCKTVFVESPDGATEPEQFQERSQAKLPNLDGKTLLVPFCKGKGKKRAVFVSNLAWSRRAAADGPLAVGLARLTEAYLLSGDRTAGLRIVAMLDRLATVYDTWPLAVTDQARQYTTLAKGKNGALTRPELALAAARKPQLADAEPAWVLVEGLGAGRLTGTIHDEARWFVVWADAYAAVARTDLIEEYEQRLPAERRGVRRRLTEQLFQPAVKLLTAHPPGKGSGATAWMRAAWRLALLFNQEWLRDRATELWEHFLYNTYWHDGAGTSGRWDEWLMTLRALVDCAEVARLVGKDAYGPHPFLKQVLVAWTELADSEGRWPTLESNRAGGPSLVDTASRCLMLAGLRYGDARLLDRVKARSRGAIPWDLMAKAGSILPADLLADAPPTSQPTTRPVGGPPANRSVNLGGLGLGMLRSSQAPLRAILDYGHTNAEQQADLLGLTLYWRGLPVVDDLGRLSSDASVNSQWTTNSGSHSLVQVDGKPQVGGFGTLADFFEAPGSFSLIDARAPSAYNQWWKSELSRYRRTVLMVNRPSGRAYVLDMFRVRGGKQHDYLLHVRADRATPSRLSPTSVQGTLLGHDHPIYTAFGQYLTLMGPPAIDQEVLVPNDHRLAWKRPSILGNGYGFIEKLQVSSKHRPGFEVTWTGRAGEQEYGLRLHALTKQSLWRSEEVLLGHGPGVSPGGKVARAVRPVFVQRRRGRSPLATTFVNLLEPFDGGSAAARSPLRVRWMDAWGTWPRWSVAVAVQADGVTDLVMHHVDDDEIRFRDAEGRLCKLRGRLGLIRVRGRKLDRLELVRGGHLMVGQLGVRLLRRSRATITKIRSRLTGHNEGTVLVIRSLDTVPTDRTLVGSTIIVTHGDDTTSSYVIEAVRPGQKKGTYELTLAGAPPVALCHGTIRKVFDGRQRILTDVDHTKSFNDRCFEKKRLRVVKSRREYRIRRVIKNKPWAANLLELDGRLGPGDGPGDPYVIVGMRIGDVLELPSYVALVRRDSDRYELRTTGDMSLLVPKIGKGLRIRYRRRDGRFVPAKLLARGEGFFIPIEDLADGSAEIRIDRSTPTTTQPSAATQPAKASATQSNKADRTET